jgi:hypothetical protein
MSVLIPKLFKRQAAARSARIALLRRQVEADAIRRLSAADDGSFPVLSIFARALVATNLDVCEPFVDAETGATSALERDLVASITALASRLYVQSDGNEAYRLAQYHVYPMPLRSDHWNLSVSRVVECIYPATISSTRAIGVYEAWVSEEASRPQSERLRAAIGMAMAISEGPHGLSLAPLLDALVITMEFSGRLAANFDSLLRDWSAYRFDYRSREGC